MPYEISKIDVWAGEVEHYPGALTRRLEALRQAGADLEFAIARPCADMPGNRILFVAPLVGAEQVAAAERIGLHKSAGITALRVSGPDRPGLLAEVAHLLADAGIIILGLSAAGIGDRCVFYFRFESGDDLRQAQEILERALA